MKITKKFQLRLSIINRMLLVISEMEKIHLKELKIHDYFDYIFITDGSRIFKLILPKPLAKDFAQRYNWDTLMENSEYYASRVTYKEIKSSRIKIYLPKYAADDFEADGYPLYRTLNGSRTGFNRYIVITKEYIFKEAKDISEL